MSSITQPLRGGFVVSLVVGAAAQASGFCPQGGLRKALLEGRPQSLKAHFAAIRLASRLGSRRIAAPDALQRS